MFNVTKVNVVRNEGFIKYNLHHCSTSKTDIWENTTKTKQLWSFNFQGQQMSPVILTKSSICEQQQTLIRLILISFRSSLIWDHTSCRNYITSAKYVTSYISSYFHSVKIDFLDFHCLSISISLRNLYISLESIKFALYCSYSSFTVKGKDGPQKLVHNPNSHLWSRTEIWAAAWQNKQNVQCAQWGLINLGMHPVWSVFAVCSVGS